MPRTKTIFGTTPTRRRIRSTISSTDAVARVKDTVEALMPAEDVIISDQVDKAWEYLAEEEPELLARYLNVLGRTAMANVVRKLQKARQTQPLPQAIFEPSSPFKELVSTQEALVSVGELKKADHLFLAAGYRKSAQRDDKLATFHSRVANQLGDKTTAEVFTEASYKRLYKSIIGKLP